MASYIIEVARMTYKVGSNNRLRITERWMTGDKHKRGRGPSLKEARRIPNSRVRDPCGCHVSGIPPREASSSQDLSNDPDIHNDCPREL
jgi:hypothetical protein